MNRKITSIFPYFRSRCYPSDNTRRRYAAERRFRFYGLAAIVLALTMLVLLFVNLITKGYTAFWHYTLKLEIVMDSEKTGKTYARVDYQALIHEGMLKLFPDVLEKDSQQLLFSLISSNPGNTAYTTIMNRLDNTQTDTNKLLVVVPFSDEVDQFLKEQPLSQPMVDKCCLKSKQITWLKSLKEGNLVHAHFNTTLFFSGDSREPEQAGILAAIIGSFYLMLVTLALSFPVGVATAIYLEEFSPRNRLTYIIEININNLAAVPSIVFGLLGLAIFLDFLGLPRSAPLVGGLVLTLIILPTIIVAARAALKTVPLSIREAALGIGASKMQSVMHHVLPLAMPGIMTGTIIGMAHALGETAPLLMIGMVAFIADVPTTPLDPATVLPVQVYLWADSPEKAFVERTAAASIILLIFLTAMNAFAVIVRKKFDRKW